MLHLYHRMSLHCGRVVTEEYSTSFASSVRLLHRDLRDAIYSIYGFVRLADEIVDTFHHQNKRALLDAFSKDTVTALQCNHSLNPILHGFQLTVKAYRIQPALIAAFLQSMEMDLHRTDHDQSSFSTYIYGSAEAVGLMCLRVFCEGNDQQYEELVPYARSLGSAFQKVNFLRDMGADHRQLDRRYFPETASGALTPSIKHSIEQDIEADFRHAATGIARLPDKARLGVYVAYKYYLSLFKKIKTIPSESITQQRVRIPNYRKWLILVAAGLRQQLRLI